MANTITIDIRVSGQLRRNLDARAVLAEPLREYFGAVTRDFRDESAGNAPEDRGKLKRSHTATVDTRPLPLFGAVRVEEETAIYVHNGTKPHWAPIRALQGWAERHGVNPFALQRSIAKKGTKAQPWFEETVDSFALSIAQKHAGTLAAAIQREWDS